MQLFMLVSVVSAVMMDHSTPPPDSDPAPDDLVGSHPSTTTTTTTRRPLGPMMDFLEKDYRRVRQTTRFSDGYYGFHDRLSGRDRQLTQRSREPLAGSRDPSHRDCSGRPLDPDRSTWPNDRKPVVVASKLPTCRRSPEQTFADSQKTVTACGLMHGASIIVPRVTRPRAVSLGTSGLANHVNIPTGPTSASRTRPQYPGNPWRDGVRKAGGVYHKEGVRGDAITAHSRALASWTGQLVVAASQPQTHRPNSDWPPHRPAYPKTEPGLIDIGSDSATPSAELDSSSHSQHEPFGYPGAGWNPSATFLHSTPEPMAAAADLPDDHGIASFYETMSVFNRQLLLLEAVWSTFLGLTTATVSDPQALAYCRHHTCDDCIEPILEHDVRLQHLSWSFIKLKNTELASAHGYCSCSIEKLKRSGWAVRLLSANRQLEASRSGLGSLGLQRTMTAF